MLCINSIIQTYMIVVVKPSIISSETLLNNLLETLNMLTSSLNGPKIDYASYDENFDTGKDKPSEKKKIDHHFSLITWPTSIYYEKGGFNSSMC